MLYKYGKHAYALVLGRFYFYFSFLYFAGVFDKTATPLGLVGY